MDDLLAMQRQTKQFIDENPITVNLQRDSLIPDGAGGHSVTPNPVGNQVFRMISQSTSSAVERRTSDGQLVSPEFVLLGEYDADARNGDFYMLDGIKYEIVYVRFDRRYETWSEVAYRG